MRRTLLLILASVMVFGLHAAPKKVLSAEEQQLYELINLDYPGLEKVKKACAKGDYAKADEELLKYYRTRTNAVQIDVDLNKVSNKKNEQRWADEALEHKFYAHKGYQPSFFYGDDIDWRYWPVRDNELRWQLHRHYWFIPLCKAYYVTKDNKYIDAWIDQYKDWIKKNPIDAVEKARAAGATKEEIQAEKENFRFAWRPMEAGRRVQDQVAEFALTIGSPRFTSDFLNLFLRMYHLHADYVMNHFSKQGNHLLFEAQRMIYAGAYFPEFKDAESWRKSGVDILNVEIGKQVFDDGVQFELDYGYHLAAIDIFLKALEMARANGMDNEFPESYIKTVESMTLLAYNFLYPDYTNPLFGDTKMHGKSTIIRQMKNWSKVFPQNSDLLWFATQGKHGTEPSYNSYAFKTAGYYILRNSWYDDATVAVFKAGPPAFWHNQPDNGTFEYWRKGRNFFPDSGCYVYGGDKEVLALREWFRRTASHNTLTLDDRNLDTTDSDLLLWDDNENMTTLITENPSYEGLKHRRSVYFMKEDGVMIIADQASGTAAGKVAVHFGLAVGKPEFDRTGTLTTKFSDGNNIRVKTKCSAPAVVAEEEGWTSEAYRQREQRFAYKVETDKTDKDVLFITVIVPDDDAHKGSIAIVANNPTMSDQLSFAVRIGAKTYQLGYGLQK